MPTITGPIRPVIPAKVSTTDATTTTLATIPIPDDSSALIDVWVEAFRTDGADQGAYRRRAIVFRRAAGVATFQGTVDSPFTRESSVPWNVTIDVDGGNNARVRVTGQAGKSINWTCQFTVSIGE